VVSGEGASGKTSQALEDFGSKDQTKGLTWKGGRPMRALATSLTAAMLLTIVPSVARAQTPSTKDMLALQPTLKGVDYETPAPEAIESCKVEQVLNAQKKPIGWALRDGQGKLLRKFVANKGAMDQWSYYQDGFEVYRESDLDGNGVLDECRWLNAAGTRIATVSQRKINGWKRLSAEEASRVLVQGLVQGDLNLIESVIATPAELTALGIPQTEVDQLKAAEAKRLDAIKALQKTLFGLGWSKATVWNRFDCQSPHLIPTDSATGPSKDLVLYENAIIFAGVPTTQASPANLKVAFLQAPEIVQVGDTWKFVELPRAIDPEKPVMTAEGGLRASLFRQQAGPAGGESPEAEGPLRALAEYDNANGKVMSGRDKQAIAQFHVGRIPLLRAVVKVMNEPTKFGYESQIVDSLAAAYSTGFYPKAESLLVDLSKGTAKINSYAGFRLISARFSVKNDEPGANLMANQKAWMSDLKTFVSTYQGSDEVPEALMQLANVNEYNAEEDEARKYYNQLVAEYPATDWGKKAAGAVKRLDLVGKSLELKSTGLRGEEINLAKYRGKTILVAFWASWAEPVKRDLPELLKVYNKYHSKDFEILGVDLDNSKEDLDAFLKENPLPWVQVFEPGGIEKNRFATEFGIIALPTMILVDAQGKVVNRNIRSPGELERQLEQAIDGKQAGVALDR
jgi:thiol-disulfide isomerase/thioredoxin